MQVIEHRQSGNYKETFIDDRPVDMMRENL